MKIKLITKITAVCLMSSLYSSCKAEDAIVSPDKIISEFESIFGSNIGQRKNHTQGTCAVGDFIGSKDIRALSASPLFSGKKIPVVARFSLAGGNINAPDTSKNPRGMALEFILPKNNIQHMTMLNVPVFAAATPQTFYEGILAGKPDPVTGKLDVEKVMAFRAAHPDTKPLIDFMTSHNPPTSYTSSEFFGIHTFKLLNSKGKVTLVRWRFEPENGVVRLTDDEIRTGPSRFLEERLISELETRPVNWRMILTIGEDSDVQDNPTLMWPDNRREIQAGVLTIKTASSQTGSSCENINFDPLVMARGIAPSNDPVLLFRSGAYAISYSKRINQQ